MCYLTRAECIHVQNKTRYVVLSLFVSLLLFSAGCIGASVNDDSTRNILLVNQDDTSHAVVVEISDDSGVVYSDGRTVDAESDLNMAQFNRTGEYEVKVTVDGDSTTIHHTFQFDDRPIQITNIGIDNEAAVTVE